MTAIHTISCIVLASLSVALAGCAHTPAVVEGEARSSRVGEVGVSDITDLVPVAARMVMADSETFLMPLARHDNALPPYPEALLAQRLPPQTACLRVSIDSAGGVMETAAVAQPPDCPAAGTVDAQFFAAAADAARGWRFEPAMRCAYPNLQAQQIQDCSGGRETPQAVSLAYRFVFEQRAGRGSVRVSGDPE